MSPSEHMKKAAEHAERAAEIVAGNAYSVDLPSADTAKVCSNLAIYHQLAVLTIVTSGGRYAL